MEGLVAAWKVNRPVQDEIYYRDGRLLTLYVVNDNPDHELWLLIEDDVKGPIHSFKTTDTHFFRDNNNFLTIQDAKIAAKKWACKLKYPTNNIDEEEITNRQKILMMVGFKKPQNHG